MKTGSWDEYLSPGGMRMGEWRRLHSEKIHSLYRSPNIVRVIKSRRLRWAGYVARVDVGRSAFKILTGKSTEIRVFENRILRRIFGPKGEENRECRRLHNEELHSLYRLANIVRVIKSRRLRWACHLVRMEEGGSAFEIETGKPTGKRPLGRTRRRWEDNVGIDLKGIGINTRSRVPSVQDRDY